MDRASEPGYFRPVDLTTSYLGVMPAGVLKRYDWCETRNAAAVIHSTDRAAFDELVKVLRGFKVAATDITTPGANESAIPKRLNIAFRDQGWREGTHNTEVESVLTLEPYDGASESKQTVVRKTIVNAGGYKIDNVKRRVVLDVEWHAKDGNLYRDVATYRSLYDAAVIDAGVVLTRRHAAIKQLSIDLGRSGGFATTTTTTLDKLEPQLLRGDGGGCPVLGIGITERCYDPNYHPA